GACDFMSPYDNEFMITMAPYLPNGSIVWKAMGVFFITYSDPDDSGKTITLALKGVDRAGRLSRYALTAPRQIASGTNGGTAIQTLLNAQWPAGEPALQYNFTPVTYTTPLINLDVNQ